MASSNLTQGTWETLGLLQVRLDKVGGAKPGRRLRIGELDRLTVKQVRPLVHKGQKSVLLELGSQRKQVWLTLDWLQRWGGTFGPKSSAEANRNRGKTSSERFMATDEEPSPERKAQSMRTTAASSTLLGSKIRIFVC